MNIDASLEEIEDFAESIGPDAKGAWFNPFAMATSMLSLAQRVRDQERRLLAQLGAWDSLTLDIARLIEASEHMQKKDVRARLEEIYETKRWPSGGAR